MNGITLIYQLRFDAIAIRFAISLKSSTLQMIRTVNKSIPHERPPRANLQSLMQSLTALESTWTQISYFFKYMSLFPKYL
jgi:hypothetical protein